MNYKTFEKDKEIYFRYNQQKQRKKTFKKVVPANNPFKVLKNLNLLDDLNDFALIKKKLTLGICLGMQIMCDFSEEGNVSGLGWVNAKIKKFTTDNKLQFKIPHVGWNQIKIAKKNDLFNGIEESSEFYFVHSYFAEPQNKSIILNKTNSLTLILY